MPHGAMVALFGAAFLYALAAIAMGVRNFWRDGRDVASAGVSGSELRSAARDAAALRNLDGGGEGCGAGAISVPDERKLHHHLTFYGFLLCFASTCVATLYHYLLGRIAPYAWHDLPVLLGTAGGIGLLIGPAGLLAAKWRRDRTTQDLDRFGMDVAFLVMLFLTSLTGLALLVLRETGAMGVLLALHLGVVFALFVTMPYGKFVHGIYRAAALARAARERHHHAAR